MSAKQDLINKLKEIFQIDRADLDFGIYKILNSRSKEIGDYLENQLPAQISQTFSESQQANIAQWQNEAEKMKTQAVELGVKLEDLPKYQELIAKINEANKGANRDETLVYNHLLTFFSRYYEAGDFISQRRYKGDTYAVPYSGEEVLLHWANKDQYYTKSGEYFGNYRFTLENGKAATFRLISANTAKDNQKDDKRVFSLWAEKTVERTNENGESEQEFIRTVEELKDGSLEVRFEYQLTGNTQKKEDEITREKITALLPEEWHSALLALAPTENDKTRTIFSKHLANYVTKNSADYFIHKELGGFLRRELDFYIKNEMMQLDDIQNAESFANIENNLRQIQTLRAIALKIIDFLAQLENFQKKLWLKKKFVAGCHYLITLDLIPTTLLPAVFANEKQRANWENLFAASILPPPAQNIDNLNNYEQLAAQHPHLVVDTSLFDTEFQNRLLSLLSEQKDLDKLTDGVLIHSDNFQALNLLQARYREQVKCIYIDPPYNTGNDGFIYKDGYAHSSWLSLISNRLDQSYELLKNSGAFITSIDDAEQSKLKELYSEKFGSNNFVAQVIWERAYSPVNLKKHFSESHDYLFFYAKDLINLICNGLPRTEEGNNRYSNPDNDPRGGWQSDNLSVGPAIPANIYEITTPSGRKVMPPSGRSWVLNKERFAEYVSDNRIWFGSDGNNVPRIKRFLSEVKNTVTPMTIWKYQDVGHSQSASQDLKKIFNDARFTYPKSVPLIKQAINLYSDKNDLILDYFAGSGTTAHAVINLNREDGGKRKYILVEQGQYFDTVLKPRVQKVIYSKDWKEGKPVEDNNGNFNGISQLVKVLKLESYEDTLNNLELKKPQADLFDHNFANDFAQDYLMHYMLEVESRESLLNTDHFAKPFNYQLNIATDSAGAYQRQRVDLVETFNYLLGLAVENVNYTSLDKHGYIRVEGKLPNKQRCLIIWRDCERLDNDSLIERLKRDGINPNDSEFDVVYLNGDHTLSAQWQGEVGNKTLNLRPIEPEFLRLMFEGA